MRSVRLDEDTERRIRDAAKLEGLSVSEFLRRAASERAERTLSHSAHDRLADVLGVVQGGSNQARQTGAAFAEVLAEKASAHRDRR